MVGARPLDAHHRPRQRHRDHRGRGRHLGGQGRGVLHVCQPHAAQCHFYFQVDINCASNVVQILGVEHCRYNELT